MVRPRKDATIGVLEAYEIYRTNPTRAIEGLGGLSAKTWLRRFRENGLKIRQQRKRKVHNNDYVNVEELEKWVSVDIDEITFKPLHTKHQRVVKELDAQLVKVGLHEDDEHKAFVLITPRTLSKRIAQRILEIYREKGFSTVADKEFEAEFNVRHGTRGKALVENITARIKNLVYMNLRLFKKDERSRVIQDLYENAIKTLCDEPPAEIKRLVEDPRALF